MFEYLQLEVLVELEMQHTFLKLLWYPWKGSNVPIINAPQFIHSLQPFSVF